MKKVLLIIIYFAFVHVVFGQDFVFDINSQHMHCPIFDKGLQREIGSNQLCVILQNSESRRDTILSTIGCSQYTLTCNSDSTILNIYLWPLYYYTTDCALEDGSRPDITEADLKITYCFSKQMVSATVYWNISKHLSSQTFHHIDYDNYLSSICYLLENGQSINEVVQEVTILNTQSWFALDNYPYWNDVIIQLLPLHNKKFQGKEIEIIKSRFDALNMKYPNR